MSDYIDRTLGLGYAAGSMILATIFLAILAFWQFSVGSVSVDNVRTPKIELLYWTTILFSNTLGTALGDFLVGGLLLIALLLALVLAAYYYTKISQFIKV